jgi:hypothetical protein
MAIKRKRVNKKLISILFLTFAIFATVTLLNQKTSWFNYASTSDGWTQNQRSLGIYILPLTSGRLYNNDRIAQDKVEPAVWLSNSELIGIIDAHHNRIIEYAGIQSGTKTQKARVFPNIVPLWVHTYVPGHFAPRGDKFPTDIMNHIRNKGAITMLDFKVGALADMSNGSKDAWLVNFGKDIGNWMTSSAGTGKSDKGWNKQNSVVIRIEPEVNAPWQKDISVRHTDWSPTNYKNAVTRIHDKLSEGIDGVPNASSKNMYIMIHFLNRKEIAKFDYAPWLPAGSKWDIMGLSVYEKNPDPIRTVDNRIENTIKNYVMKYWPTKYVWIAEMGYYYNNNNIERGTWLNDSLTFIQGNQYAYKRVKAFLYSDYDVTTGTDGNWMLRGTNAGSIAKVYGDLANKWKFQQDSIFEK